MFFNKKNVNKKYTVDQALYQIGYGSFQQNISLLSGAGIGLGAFQTIINLLIIPQIKNKILEINKKDTIWINPSCFLFCGIILGGLFWTSYGNKYGRKKAAIFSVLLNIISNISLLVVPISFFWNSINSLFWGFTLGTTITTDIQIFNDFTLYQEIKSNYLTCILYWFVIGATFAYLVSALILEKLGWRSCVLICVVMSVVLLVSRIKWLYDSPRFLVREHRLYSAADTLYIIAEKNKTQLPSGTLENYSKENVINDYNTNSLECFSLSHFKDNSIFMIISFTYSYTIFTILTSMESLLNQNSQLYSNASSSLLLITMVVATIIIFSLSLTSLLPINKNIMVVTSFIMSTAILFYGLSSNWKLILISSMVIIISFFISAFCLLIQAINNTSQKYKLSIISMMGYCLSFSGIFSILTYESIERYFDPTSKLQFLICSILSGITILLTVKTRNLNEITRIISIDSYEEFIPKKDKYFYKHYPHSHLGSGHNSEDEIKILYTE